MKKLRSLAALIKKKLSSVKSNTNKKPDKIHELIQACEKFIIQMPDNLNANIEVLDKKGLIINIDGIRIFIESKEDVFIINEIFNENVYGLYSKDDFILIDVGLNIGIASLFFNQMRNIKKIYAYEPVLDTFNKCLYNLSLNQDISKIKIYNYGLGAVDGIKTFNFSDSYKGSVGNFDLSDYKKKDSSSIKKVEVKIKNASEIISNIINENPKYKFIIKMDCEGAEYEIIPNLKVSGVLDKIDLIMLEWHKIEFLELLDCFSDFNCFFNKNSSDTGMIYASKRNNP